MKVFAFILYFKQVTILCVGVLLLIFPVNYIDHFKYLEIDKTVHFAIEEVMMYHCSTKLSIGLSYLNSSMSTFVSHLQYLNRFLPYRIENQNSIYKFTTKEVLEVFHEVHNVREWYF